MSTLISIIVAASQNNAIGKNNALLWKLPNDMKFFKNTTWGHPIIMGRKTFESMGSKPLPGRKNIILTTAQTLNHNDVTIAHNINQALEIASLENTKEIFIIGGAEIYKQCLKLTNRIYFTRVFTTIDGDAFFEPINETEFSKIASQAHEADDKHAFNYNFEVWERNS